MRLGYNAIGKDTSCCNSTNKAILLLKFLRESSYETCVVLMLLGFVYLSSKPDHLCLHV